MALAKVPEEDMLLALLETQLRKSKALEPAFVTYDAAEIGSETRTSAFLYYAARRQVVRKQTEETVSSLMKMPQIAVPARPPKASTEALPPAAPKVPAVPAPPARTADGKIICPLWLMRGSCQYGDGCHFEHAEPPKAGRRARGKAQAAGPKGQPQANRPQASALSTDAAENVTATAAGDDAPLCRFWPLGKCYKGNQCVYRHVGPPGKPAAPAAQPAAGEGS